MEEKLHYRINVTGQVQGVGFRWNAAKEARTEGISGFVKNLPDGSVYIEAEGSENALKTFLEWCKKGPRFGLVESVYIEKMPVVNYTDFRIEL
jgi:acylphosphatase